MQGSTTIRKWYSLLGVGLTLCAVGLLVSAGCQTGGGGGGGGPTCDVDADCDDGLFCNGAETCVDGECQAAEDECTADQECDEEADICQDVCDTVADCPDDDDPCTDATCVEGVCGTENNTADCVDDDACTEGDVCADGECAGTAIECAEGEECVDGECVSTAECSTNADCADDLYCNGEETCVDGACVDGTSPCDAGETCDEATDTCVGCTTDADCDDDLFCNGTETCVAEVCSNGVEPCDATEVCEEDTNECVSNVETTFTLEQDDLTGSAGNDTFSAATALSGLGAQLNTIQSGDIAAGLAGDDTLNATLVNGTGAALTIAPTLSAIEVLNFSDFATAFTITISGANITGATDINLLAGLNNTAAAFQVTGLPSIVDASIAGNSEDFEIIYASSAASGAANTMTLTVSNSTDGTFADRSQVRISAGSTNALESLTVHSTGSANRLNTLTQTPTAGTAGTSLATLTITGNQNLAIGAIREPLTVAAGVTVGRLDDSITTITASAFTGSLAGSEGLIAGTSVLTFTGGSGNDEIALGYVAAGPVPTSVYTTGDTINGGTGTDTLGLISADAAPAANQTNVSNIEALRIINELATSPTLSRWGSGVVSVSLDDGGAGGVITYPAGATNVLSLGALGITDASGSGALGATLSGVTTDDVLALNLNDCDQVGAVTITQAETVNLASNLNLTGGAASGGVNVLGAALVLTGTAATETLNITGTEALTITGAVTADVVNAGTFAQVLTMSATSLGAGSMTITGGSADDVLYGSANADTINGGTGADVILGQAGADIMTGASGADTFRFPAVADVTAGTPDTIGDFTTAAGGDILSIDADADAGDFNLTAGTVDDTIDGFEKTAGGAHGKDAEITVITTAVVGALTSANAATAIGSATGAYAVADTKLFLVSNGTDSAVFYFTSAGADATVVTAELAAGPIMTLAGVDSTELAALVVGNFAFADAP